MVHQRPDIILFTTDQHRGDHIGLAGHSTIRTPNLDSWVNRGAYFPNAYTEIPSTTGARRVLLGGKGSYDCGLIGYAAREWFEPNTLAAVLAAAGYHCINVGWRNLHPRRKLYGFHTVIPHDLHRGDDDYWDWLVERAGPWARERGHGADANGWVARPWHLAEELHPTVWTVDAAMDHLARRDPTSPVFLWVSHLRPHSPYDPPQHFWDMYVGRELPDPPVGDWAGANDVPVDHADRTAWRGRIDADDLQRMRAGYMGCITHIDYQLGRMMEDLQRELGGLAERAFWVFASDHGDMMGDHHLMRKSYAYEGSARIPLVLRYPAGADWPSGTFEHVAGLQDIMPTVLDAAGVTPPDGLTGQSLLAAARGESWREFFHGEHSPCYDPDNAMHYLTDGAAKYVWFSTTGREQLFDLTGDRRELHDLSADPACAEQLALWRGRLIARLAARGDGFSDGRTLLTKPPGYGPVIKGHPANVPE